ncbi:MAG: hypothetical protein JW909_11780 [Planctomycetes bacterium]|nr:hypothetical protein [Planctomycetota bacterium]
MHLKDITGEILRKALAIYCKHAWPRTGDARCGQLVVWRDGDRAEDLLKRMNDESARTKGTRHRRYTIRAGNERYPFMKMGMEEWIREGEFFLYVATHDEMELPADDPDYGAWQELRKYNAELKRRIEEAWHGENLPTLKDTKAMCPLQDGEKTAIIGENTGYEAEALAALLGEEGYNTMITADTEILLREARLRRPDLIVVNSFVGEVPGHIVAEALKDDPQTRGIPLMVITSPLDRLEHLEATFILPKPVTIEGLKRALAPLSNS